MGLLAGIVEGALGGAGRGLVNVGEQSAAAQYRSDLADQQAALERQKLDYAAQIATQQRAAMAQRIQDAMPGVVNARIAEQMPDPTGHTTDNQLAADQAARDALRARLMVDPHVRVAAGESTGDVAPGTGAQLLQRGDNALLSQQWHMDHNDALRERNEDRAAQAERDRQARLDIAAMRHDGSSRDAAAATREEAANLRAALADASRNLNEKRLELKQVEDNLSILPPGSPEAAGMQRQHDSLMADVQELQASHKDIQRRVLGSTGPAAASRAAPTGAPPPGPDAVLAGDGAAADPFLAQFAPHGAAAKPTAPPPAPSGLPKGWTVTGGAVAPARTAAPAAAPADYFSQERARKMTQLQGLAALRDQAYAQLRSAPTDPTAARAVQDADTTLRRTASSLFGNSAPQALSEVGA